MPAAKITRPDDARNQRLVNACQALTTCFSFSRLSSAFAVDIFLVFVTSHQLLVIHYSRFIVSNVYTRFNLQGTPKNTTTTND